MKKCSKCKLEKQLDQFVKRKNYKDGLASWCKKCNSIKTKEWYSQNKEKANKYAVEYLKTWKPQNEERVKEYMKTYNQENKDIIKEKQKLYFIKNKQQILKKQKLWLNENKERVSKYSKDYIEKNPHIRKWRNILISTLSRLDIPKSANTQTLLGYSAIQLKEHLDKQNMNWEIDHIDHKIPVSWFESTTPIHVVNDLRNLQPLKAEENRKKSNKFGSPTDISYINDVKIYIKEKYLNELWKLKND
jgi:hypothetical protein